MYRKSMTASGQGRERVNQKRRTRAALIDAAQRLLEQGRAPSVADVADEALVSRATAYRYFPTQEHLLLDVVLERSIDEIHGAVTAAAASDDAPARLEGVVRAVSGEIASKPTAFRNLLRLSAAQPRTQEETVASIRGERRLRWIEHALEPVESRLAEHSYRRLRSALALCMGAEAFVVLRDLCGLEDGEAEETLCWAARGLLGAALEEAAADSKRS
jgi:AcrR family transcriptional regulator